MVRLSSVTPSHIRRASFDRFKHERRAFGLTPAGVNRELALARASLNLAVERRLIAYSPFDGVKLFDEPEAWPREISFAEESRILDCCELRLRTLLTLLVETGLRVGIEALPIKWSDIDLQEATIRVTRSKTAAGKRIVPMTTLCKSALLKWRQATKGQSEYVFFNPQIPAKHIRSVKTAWHNALRAAGLAPFAIYCCRHTYTTRLLAAGVPNAIVDQLIGHGRRRGDVLRFYSARVMEYLRDAVRDLEKLRKTKESAFKIQGAIGTSRHMTKGSELIQ